MKPIIAIVGRPNVGKSTLFNRIIGRRQALVNDMAGVTRDRHYADADWCGKEFRLIDTGGISTAGVGFSTPAVDKGACPRLEDFIRQQTFTAISEADAVICLFDGRENPTAIDKSIVELLRKSGKRVVYAVNKIERQQGKQSKQGRQGLVEEFYELGLSADIIFPISAEHGIGVDELLDKIIAECGMRNADLKSAINNPQSEIRIAVIGRPNAGKSTLINHLAGSERVIAHEMPGTTRDTIDVEIDINHKKYIFVDTAGLKKKGKTIEALDKFSAIKTLDVLSRADIAILVIDSNEGFTHQDSALLDRAYEEGKGVLVLFNKWDALTHDAKKLEKFYSDKLLKLHKVSFLCISAKTGQNVEKIFEEVENIRQALAFKFSTSELNRIMEDFKERHNIPNYKGRAVKIYYATQVKTMPPTFLIFANHPEGVAESYKRYLANKLQDVIGIGVPIRIRFKKK